MFPRVPNIRCSPGCPPTSLHGREAASIVYHHRLTTTPTTRKCWQANFDRPPPDPKAIQKCTPPVLWMWAIALLLGLLVLVTNHLSRKRIDTNALVRASRQNKYNASRPIQAFSAHGGRLSAKSPQPPQQSTDYTTTSLLFLEQLNRPFQDESSLPRFRACQRQGPDGP